MNLPLSEVLLAGALAILLAITVQAATHAIVIPHEGGHALFAFLMGGEVRGVYLFEDGGLTRYMNPNWAIGRFITTFSGYFAPSLFGLLAILLMFTSGDPVIVIWASIALLALLLAFAANVRAFVKITAFGALFFLIARSSSVQFQEFVALTWIWWLLVGAVVSILDRMAGGGSGDAGSLRNRTKIPRILWDLIFLAGTLVLLVVGAGQLFGLIGPRYS